MTTKLFSIITITKNNLEGLERTAKSIQLQSCDNYEWIIVDGASTDGTEEFLKTVNAKIISEPDNGLYDAMNKGIENANGAWIIFMNAGDVFADGDVLETVEEQLELKPDFIYGDSLEVTKDGLKYKRSKPYTKMPYGMVTHHQAMIYKRESIGDLRYDLNYKIAADYDFTLRTLKRCERPLYIPSPICIFESGGVSQKNAKLGRSEQFQIRKKQNTVPAFLNGVISILQFLNWQFRKHCPKFYWKLNV